MCSAGAPGRRASFRSSSKSKCSLRMSRKISSPHGGKCVGAHLRQNHVIAQVHEVLQRLIERSGPSGSFAAIESQNR